MRFKQGVAGGHFVERLSLWFPAIIACLLWSTSFAGVKIGLQSMTPFLFAGIRFVIAGFLVLLFTTVVHYRFRLKRLWKDFPPVSSIFTIAILQTFGMYAFHYSAMDWVPGAVTAIIIGSSPLLASLITHIVMNDDPLSVRKIISIGIGIAGIVLLSLGKQFTQSDNSLMFLGILFLFVSMSLSIFANIFVKKNPAENPLILNGVQLVLGGSFLILFSLILEKEPIRVEGALPLSFWAVLLWLSLVSAVAFSIWTTLLKRPAVKVSELNLWKFLIPVCGAALAWLLVPGESFDWITFGGMGVVSAAILIYFV